jgi:Putative Ig domain/FG-GAP-like repeat/Domain of unknown function (DUF4114)
VILSSAKTLLTSFEIYINLMANEIVNFTSAANFAVGSDPYSATVTDFNSDGKADLAVTNYDTANASVLLGNGNGSFGTATNFAVGANPFTIVSADFNSDGKADLVTSGYKDGKISLLLGIGNGSFGTAIDFAVGTHLIDIAVGDFNRDGKPDLAVADDSANLAFLSGNGAGSFGTPTKLAIGTTPISVTVGDANGDGIVDLIAANSGDNNLSVLFGDGQGNFGVVNNVAVGNSPAVAAVGDFNRDGIPDLAAANYKVNSIAVLLGTGNGQFGAATNFAVGNVPFSLSVKDLNGDGNLDLATVNNSGNSASVLLGTGTGSFAPVKNFAVGDNPGFGTFGDFNNDGRFDLVSVNRGSNNVSVLLNSTVVTSTNRPPIVTNSIPAQTINSGSALNFVVAANTFTDPDPGDVLSYSAKLTNGNSLPTWLTFDPTTKTFAGTPGAGNVGTLGITVTASDQAGLTIANAFDLKVNSVVTLPTGGQNLGLEIVKLDTTLPNNPAMVKIDLTQYAGQSLKADITTTASAAYTNNIGFYTIEDSIGSIKLADGSLVKPGDVNYAAAAIKNALANSLQAGKNDSQLNLSIADGKIYAPIVISQGSLTDFMTKNSSNAGGANEIHAYFNYLGANPDKIDHFRLVSNNTFGFEDLYGGGDKDFNDLVVTMKVRTV